MSDKEPSYIDYDYGDQLFLVLNEGLQLATPEQKAEIEILRELLLTNLGVMSGLWPDKSEESTKKLVNYARWSFHIRVRIAVLLAEMKGKEVDPELTEVFSIDWGESPFAQALANYKQREGNEALTLH